MFTLLNFAHLGISNLSFLKTSVSKLWPLKAAEKIKGSVNRLRESWMDSKTHFNRLRLCRSVGAGLDLPSACQSCLILLSCYCFCLHVLHLSDSDAITLLCSSVRLLLDRTAPTVCTGGDFGELKEVYTFTLTGFVNLCLIN